MAMSRKFLVSREIYHSREGTLEYFLKRSLARRTVAIMVDVRGQVSVLCPGRVSHSVIEDFLEEKAHWIVQKIRSARAKAEAAGKIIFEHGQEFLFLGQKFPLMVRTSEVARPRVHFTGTQWVIILPAALGYSQALRQDAIRKALMAWYRLQAREIMGGRIFHYSRIMAVSPQKIVVRTQKRMWGCCHFHTQTIHLNWQLVMSPLRVIDYVVVHEMCHLWIPNHSRRFWSKVREFMPDFESAREWLKANHLQMMLPEPMADSF